MIYNSVTDPSQRENLGIIVQYKVKVKLSLGPLGGDVVAELPFVLMHPKPEESNGPNFSKSIEDNDKKPTETNDQVNKQNIPMDTNLIQLDA